MSDAFHEVRRLLKVAIRNSLAELQLNCRDRSIYAFALQDSSEGTGPGPFANSEEHWNECLVKAGTPGRDEDFSYRWNTGEWADRWIDTLPYCPIGKLLGEESWRWKQELQLEPDSSEWEEFQMRSFAASIGALEELFKEGVFTVNGRPLTVFFTITDDMDDVWLGRESARRCNSEEIFQEFDKQWSIYNQDYLRRFDNAEDAEEYFEGRIDFFREFVE